MSLGLMKLFAKNSPEGFAIHWLTCAGEILPQRIINECLVAVARLFSPGPEGIDDIIIQVNGDSGLTPGKGAGYFYLNISEQKKDRIDPFSIF